MTDPFIQPFNKGTSADNAWELRILHADLDPRRRKEHEQPIAHEADTLRRRPVDFRPFLDANFRENVSCTVSDLQIEIG